MVSSDRIESAEEVDFTPENVREVIAASVDQESFVKVQDHAMDMYDFFYSARKIESPVNSNEKRQMQASAKDFLKISDAFESKRDTSTLSGKRK